MRKLLLLLVCALALPTGVLAGTTWQKATKIDLGASAKGSLSKDNTVEWYRFEVTKDGSSDLQITPSGTLHLQDITLYTYSKADKSDIAQRSNMNLDKASHTLSTTDLAPGTYFVRVRRWDGAGDFTLVCGFTENSYTNDGVHDTFKTAKALKSGKTVDGHLGYAYFNDRNTEDWYSIEVTADGKADFTVTPDQTFELHLQDITLYTYSKADKSDIAQRASMNLEKKKATLSVTDLAPGTYILRLRRWNGHGGYKLRYVFTDNSFADDGKHDKFSTAKALPSGTDVQGHLGYVYYNDRNTEDWYKFDVTADGKADFTVTPDQTFELHLQDITLYTYSKADKSDIAQRSSMNLEKKKATLTVSDLAPGTYLLRLRRWDGHGGYTLRYTFTASSFTDDGKHDKFSTAKALPSGTDVQGHLGYVYYNDRNTEDWYKFDVTADGKADFTVTPDQTFALHLQDITLYTYSKADKSDIAQRSSKNLNKDAATLTVSDLAPGTYFLRLRRWDGHGGYTLRYTFTENPFADDGKHDSFATAKKLENGITAQGHLGYTYYNDRNTVDWYKFDVTADGKLELTVNPSQTFALHLQDICLYTYNADKSDIAQRQSLNLEKKVATMTTVDVAPGTYFIRVRRWDGHGGYRLKALLTPNGYANDAEANNSWQTAVKLDANKTVTGHLGYVYYNDRDTEDWYRITLAANGSVTMTVRPDQEFSLHLQDITLYAYNKDKTDVSQKKSMNLEKKEAELKVDNLDAGTYFVRLRRWNANGAYFLKFGTKLDKISPTAPDIPFDKDDINSTKDPEGGQNNVEVGTTTFTVDDETKTVTVTDVKPDKQGNIHISRLPKPEKDWEVQVEPDVFKNLPGKNVTIDYPKAPKVNGTITKNDVKNVTLHVPGGSKDDYEKSKEWKKFGSIKEDNNGGSQTSLIAWMDGGEKHYYNLAEKPKVTLTGGNYTLTTTMTVITYLYGDLQKLTLDDGSGTTPIDAPVATVSSATAERVGESVVFTGCKPYSPIYIYNVGGQTVGSLRTDADGRAEVSISDLKTGVYIVKSDSVTIKIAKR